MSHPDVFTNIYLGVESFIPLCIEKTVLLE
jgi:hypothetical protein